MHTISNPIVNWQLHALRVKKVDLTPVYRALGTSEKALAESGRLLTAEEFAVLMRASFELVDDEAVGYTQKPLRIGTFRMLCHASIDCHNLRRALLRMIDFFRLLSDEFDWSLKEQGEEAVVTFNCEPNGVVENGFFVASMMTILWRWASWMIDLPILLNRVYFSFDENFICDESEPELQGIFRSAIYFNQVDNQLVIPAEYLDLPVKQNSDSLIPFLAHSPECLMSHYQADSNLSAQVKQHIENINELDSVTLESVAEAFEMSSQTLARHLKKEGHQFQQLKDKVRKSRAINLLIRSDLSIGEISHELGFSEDSVFYRNFKKWTGITPSAYRQGRG